MGGGQQGCLRRGHPSGAKTLSIVESHCIEAPKLPGFWNGSELDPCGQSCCTLVEQSAGGLHGEVDGWTRRFRRHGLLSGEKMCLLRCWMKSDDRKFPRERLCRVCEARVREQEKARRRRVSSGDVAMKSDSSQAVLRALLRCCGRALGPGSGPSRHQNQSSNWRDGFYPTGPRLPYRLFVAVTAGRLGSGNPLPGSG